MPGTLFDRDAPKTVRAGVVCLFAANVLDFVQSLSRQWAGGGPGPGLWQGILRPILGLVVGLVWAWGIGQMLGLFYWFWVVLMVLAAALVLVMLGLSVFGLGSGFAGHEWTPPDVLGLVLILTAVILLLSKPSLRAYRSHGRLVWKKPAAEPSSPVR
ncbi:MAG TPA: hypothetical protein VEW47_16225 [Candidatus Dormibacteraeota bacterium]|nr:hypothetical protein [Candidatus Dormibacteraeota bacterium]